MYIKDAKDVSYFWTQLIMKGFISDKKSENKMYVEIFLQEIIMFHKLIYSVAGKVLFISSHFIIVFTKNDFLISLG